jgi:hypothetical protein
MNTAFVSPHLFQLLLRQPFDESHAVDWETGNMKFIKITSKINENYILVLKSLYGPSV